MKVTFHCKWCDKDFVKIRVKQSGKTICLLQLWKSILMLMEVDIFLLQMMSLRTLERLNIIPMLKITCNLIILLGFSIQVLGLSFKISLLNRNSLKSGFYYIKFLVAPFSSLKLGFLLNRGLLNRGSTVLLGHPLLLPNIYQKMVKTHSKSLQ